MLIRYARLSAERKSLIIKRFFEQKCFKAPADVRVLLFIRLAKMVWSMRGQMMPDHGLAEARGKTPAAADPGGS
jgi:hypothetical protein